MKKTSEVGLSVRVVKGKVFLLKGGAVDLNEERIAFDLNDLIACSEQIGSFPLLVIEDGVKMLAEHSSEVQEATYTPQHKITYKHGFMDGYNKAKETYKFTEEDLRKAIDLARDCESDCGGVYFMEGTSEEIIQSLTQKELYVEVDCEYGDNCPSKGAYDKQYLCKIIPRITDNKIKAIWK